MEHSLHVVARALCEAISRLPGMLRKNSARNELYDTKTSAIHPPPATSSLTQTSSTSTRIFQVSQKILVWMIFEFVRYFPGSTSVFVLRLPILSSLQDMLRLSDDETEYGQSLYRNPGLIVSEQGEFFEEKLQDPKLHHNHVYTDCEASVVRWKVC